MRSKNKDCPKTCTPHAHVDTCTHNAQADSLKGPTGFTLQGVNAGDYAGAAVATLDVNGDGLKDILIGAPGAKRARGEGYIVFGNSGFGAKDVTTLSLADLDGAPISLFVVWCAFYIVPVWYPGVFFLDGLCQCFERYCELCESSK
jgi:hypothetical protein